MTDSNSHQRTTTIAWADPAACVEAARTHSGLDFLTAWRSGAFTPPFAELLGVRLVGAERGLTRYEYRPEELHLNALGTVHGGIVTTLLDTAMGTAVHSLLDAGVLFTSIDVHVHFLRPVVALTGTLTCIGTVAHNGSRIAMAEARVEDGFGKLFAKSSSTCLILPSA